MKFNGDTFKILQLADVQDTQRTSQDTLNFMRALLGSEKPDLVILTGDQVKGYGLALGIGDKKKNTETTIRNILAPITERNIPFTFTYGNHDRSDEASLEFQTSVYESYSSCVNKDAFARYKGTDCMCFPIYAEDGRTPVFAVYAINDCHQVEGKYHGVTEEQIQWCKDTAEALAAENGGEKVPTIVFEHIPVYEMYEILKEVPKNTPGALEGNRTHRGKYYVITDEMAARGEYMRENIACFGGGSKQFDGWCEQGNIVAAYFGHDHINTFTGKLRGIELGYTPGAGFNIYGPGLDRAARVFEFDESGSYTTRLVTYRDLLGKKVKEPLKLFMYEHSPSSTDDLKRKLKKCAPYAAATAAVIAAAVILKKRRGK